MAGLSFLISAAIFGSMGRAMIFCPIFKNVSGWWNIPSYFFWRPSGRDAKLSSLSPQMKNLPAMISTISPSSPRTARFSSLPLILPSSWQMSAKGSSKKYAASISPPTAACKDFKPESIVTILAY